MCFLVPLASCKARQNTSSAFNTQSTLQEAAARSLGNPLALVFLNQNEGWILFKKSLWKINQGGRDWELKIQLPASQDPLKESNFHSFCVQSSHEVWLNLSNKIIVSYDSGTSWSTILELNQLEHINDLAFRDENHGWAVVTRFVNFTDRPFGLQTTDAGKTWQQSDYFTSRDPQTALGLELYTVESLNNGAVWISGTGAIWSSKDGGRTWRLANVVINGESNTRLSTLQFLNENEGYGHCGPAKGAAPHYLVRTADGGRSWQMVNTPVASTTGLSDFHFFNFRHGFGIFQGSLFETGDGGNHWKELKMDYIAGDIIFFLDEDYGWMTGENDTLFSTRNGGKTWQRLH